MHKRKHFIYPRGSCRETVTPSATTQENPFLFPVKVQFRQTKKTPVNTVQCGGKVPQLHFHPREQQTECCVGSSFVLRSLSRFRLLRRNRPPGRKMHVPHTNGISLSIIYPGRIIYFYLFIFWTRNCHLNYSIGLKGTLLVCPPRQRLKRILYIYF